MTNILTKAEFNKLPLEERKELMESWREQASNRDIYNAMGISSDAYYKICRTLEVKPKTVVATSEENTSQMNGEQVFKEESTTPPSLQLSVENKMTKQQAEALFNSILNFLNGEEYHIKVEISK